MKRILLSENVEISELVLGMMRITQWGLKGGELAKRIYEVMEDGITTFDHADCYGNGECEKLFGDALKEKPSARDQYQIITKTGLISQEKRRPYFREEGYDFSKQHIIESAEASLKRLNTDYIDVFLLHRPSPLMDPNEIAEAISTLFSQGKIKSFGVSNYLPCQFSMLQSYVDVPIVTNQIKLSVFCTDAFYDGTMENALQNRIPLLAYSPVDSGKIHQDVLSQRDDNIKRLLIEIMYELGCEDIDKVLYAWLMQHPAKILPIIGSGNPARIKAAVAATDLKLTNKQWFDILRISRNDNVSKKYNNL